MKTFIGVLAVALAASIAVGEEIEQGKQWAFLVTGCNGWFDYAGQADISHAYQVVKRRGVPDENIIVMMYDDNAHDPVNPQPGVLINKPDGPNVYKGVKVDYRTSDVTPDNFLAVLSGDKAAMKGKGSGRVIESGPNDHIFVAYVSHGTVGFVRFPSANLYATDYDKTLKKMASDNKFSKLVIHHVSCFGGSMFVSLDKDGKVLASSASNAKEEAMKCYCKYKSYPCLGSTYGTNWMQYVDKALPPKVTLREEYDTIKTMTTDSHVTLYGDVGIDGSLLENFIGHKNIPAEGANDDVSDSFSVPAREATLHYFKRMAKFGRSREERMKYSNLAEELEKNREVIDQIFDEIINTFVNNDERLRHEIVNTNIDSTEEGLRCQKKLTEHFNKECFPTYKNVYSLKHFYKFANVCETYAETKVEDLMNAISKTCEEGFQHLTNVY